MEIAGTVQRRPLILVSLLLAAFVINLDITIVNVALPTLVRELHASNSQLQWVVDAYNLLFAALLLAAGSLSDRLGRKGFLLAGLVVFGAASIAGGLTDTAGQLIVARCFMGLGAAMIFPTTLSLISNVYTERVERADLARSGRAQDRLPGTGSLQRRDRAADLHADRGPQPRLEQRPHPRGLRGRSGAVRGLHPPGAQRSGADARRQPLPQPSLHRRQRFRHDRILRDHGLQLPDHPVLPVPQRLWPALHGRPPAAGRV